MKTLSHTLNVLVMQQIQPLAEGQPAPHFTARTLAGEVLDTASLAGKSWVVYFYPKDDTPGCTREACEFRDHWTAFKEADIQVIGVSCDSDESHAKFQRKHQLPFALAADESREIVNAFGVFGEKKFMGRTFEGVHRISFLVGSDGVIKKVYPKVKPDAHAREILADARKLT